MAGLDELAPYRTPPPIAQTTSAVTPWLFVLGFMLTLTVAFIVFRLLKKRRDERTAEVEFRRAIEQRNRPKVLEILLRESALSLDALKSQTSEGDLTDFLSDLYRDKTPIDWNALAPKLMALFKAQT